MEPASIFYNKLRRAKSNDFFESTSLLNSLIESCLCIPAAISWLLLYLLCQTTSRLLYGQLPALPTQIPIDMSASWSAFSFINLFNHFLFFYQNLARLCCSFQARLVATVQAKTTRFLAFTSRFCSVSQPQTLTSLCSFSMIFS